MAKTMIAGVQMDCEIGNPAANRDKIVKHLRIAAERGAELAVFPECAVTGYCFESLEEAAQFAEPIDGPSAELFLKVCRETGIHAVVGFIEKDGGNLYNAAMILGPGGILGVYRKVHLPFLGVDRFLTRGDKPFEALDLPFGKIGVNICYDVSFPEAARVLKLSGAELIVLPTNWPTGAWRTPEYVINSRANENHVNFFAVDRVGIERGWQFIGRTKAVDFIGDTIGELSREEEEILFAQIDFQGAAKNKIVNVPGAYEMDRVLDRRPEFYGIITGASSRSQAAD